MIPVLIAGAAYLTLFSLIELAGRRFEFAAESTRKTAHVLSGCSVAALPWVLSFHEIALLAGMFVGVMLISKTRGIFGAIHNVQRKTYGEVYFAVSIMAVALLFPSRAIFAYAVLVMAISDAGASLIGQRYGKKKFTLGPSHKSYAGSTTFLVSTWLIGLALIPTTVITRIGMSLALAASLALVEAGLVFGLDNLLLPIYAGGLLTAALRVN